MDRGADAPFTARALSSLANTRLAHWPTCAYFGRWT